MLDDHPFLRKPFLKKSFRISGTTKAWSDNNNLTCFSLCSHLTISRKNKNDRHCFYSKQVLVSNKIKGMKFVNSNNYLLLPKKRNVLTEFYETGALTRGYSKVHELKLVNVSLASPERIRQWAEKILPSGKIFGEVTNPNTVHYKTFKPYKGGLFCERIFGPIKDFECACGIRQKPTEEESKKILEHQNVSRNFCPKCDVEYTWSVIRRYQLGYIQLVAPVCHIWYLKANPSALSILLDIKRKRLESIVYCMETMTLEKNWTCFSSTNQQNLGSENSPTSLYTAWETLSKKSLFSKKPSRFLASSFYFHSGANMADTDNKKEFLAVMLEKKQAIDFHSVFRARCHYLGSPSPNTNHFSASKHKKSLFFNFSCVAGFVADGSFCYAADLNQKEEQYKKNKKLKKNQLNVAPQKLQDWETSLIKKNFLFVPDFKNIEEPNKLLSITSNQARKAFYKKPSKKRFQKNEKILSLYLLKLPSSRFDSTPFHFSAKKPKNRNENRILKQNTQMKQNLLSFFNEQNQMPFGFQSFCYAACFFIKNAAKNRTNTFLFNQNNPLLTVVQLNLLVLLCKKKCFYFDFFNKHQNNDSFNKSFISNQPSLFLLSGKKKAKNLYHSILFQKMLSQLDNSFQFELVLARSFSNVFFSLIAFLLEEQKDTHSLIKNGSMKLNKDLCLNILSRFFSSFLTNNKPSLNKNVDFGESENEILKNKTHYKKTIDDKFSQIIYLPEKEGVNNEQHQKNLVLTEVSLLTLSASQLKNQGPRMERKMQLARQTHLSPLLLNKQTFFQKKLKTTLFSFVSQKFSLVSNLRAKANAHFLINNFYCLSSHSTWETTRNQNWNYFIRYNRAPIDIKDFKMPVYKYRTLTPTEFGLNVPITGPGLIQRLLSLFNNNELKKMAKQHQILFPLLNVEIRKKRESARTKSDYAKIQKCLQKREFLLRRLKMIRQLFKKNSNPLYMILSVLPVLPPDLRPILKLGNGVAGSDLNRFYQRIIYRNDRLKKFLKDPATSQSFAMKFALRLLQEAVDNLIHNGKGGVKPESNPRGQPLKSLSESLKGKQGRFRQYLLGKRVDYSGRSVIVVGPTLQIHQCGLPKEMAYELFSPFVIKKILSYKLARTIIGAKTLMKLNPRLTQEILCEVMQNHPILLNRAPTLHRLGIQAFQPLLIEGRAILLHPLVCPGFNADFDGDQMAVHLPLTVEARVEAWKLMFSKNNLISSATGEPVILPSQDMVLGCYYLTAENSKFRLSTHLHLSLFPKQSQKRARCFSNIDEVLKAYQNGIITVHTPIWLKWKGFFEIGNVLSEPAEIRVDSFGNWQDIREKYRRYFDSQGYFISQVIQTTPGRVLLHSILQKCLLKSS